MNRLALIKFLEGCPDSAEILVVVGPREGHKCVWVTNVQDTGMENPAVAGVVNALAGIEDEDGRWPGDAMIQRNKRGKKFVTYFPPEGNA